MTTEKTGQAIGMVLVGLLPHEVRVTATVRAPDGEHEPFRLGELPDATVRETRVRVRSAIGHRLEGYCASVSVEGLPVGAADLSCLDLPIAVAVLRAVAQNHEGLKGWTVDASPETVFAGELTLEGRVRAVRGALALVGALDLYRAARGVQVPFVMPAGNAWEVGLSPNVENIRLVDRASDLTNGIPISKALKTTAVRARKPHGRSDLRGGTIVELFDRIRDLPRILLVGPPGSGKTMLARRLASEAPALSPDELRDVVRIYGAAGLGESRATLERPFRAPHHTVSEAGLIGGGIRPRPGEVSLAHHGILFLDELTEFRVGVVDTLARVLADGTARFRHGGFPARPRCVVAAASACPCGYYADDTGRCRCAPDARKRYDERLRMLAARLGLERFDVPRVDLADLTRMPS